MYEGPVVAERDVSPCERVVVEVQMCGGDAWIPEAFGAEREVLDPWVIGEKGFGVCWDG